MVKEELVEVVRVVVVEVIFFSDVFMYEVKVCIFINVGRVVVLNI